jgi:hypothetical protein
MGCLRLLLGVLSFGLIPLLLRREDGRFVRRMDGQGFETRDGRRIAWADVTEVRHAQGWVRGKLMSDELLLSTPRGKISVPLWRAEHPAAVREYALSHLPDLSLEE